MYNQSLSDNEQFVHFTKNSRFDQKYVTTTIKHGLGCFSVYGISPIQKIKDKMDRFLYRNI